MRHANVSKTVDLNYKSGYIQCVCGWKKSLGNGFNGYYIDNCPQCTPDLDIRNQRKVTTGAHGGLKVSIGCHYYFCLSNGINVQYSKIVSSTHYVRTESQASKL